MLILIILEAKKFSIKVIYFIYDLFQLDIMKIIKYDKLFKFLIQINKILKFIVLFFLNLN